MTEDDYLSHDALGLATVIRDGDASAAEVLDAAIRRADLRNPGLNAVIHRFDERARQAAASLPQGPFTGVPFLLKDLLSTFAGEPHAMGSRGLRNYVPDYNSELVTRYIASGLNTFGKTNTPEFGLVITTEPKAFGPAHNPYRHGFSTGGSSGGSAAAVAAGIVPIAGGGDGGGSIRLPASWCGVVGMKPSRGRVPCGPDAGEHWNGAVAEHVLTRSVRDSAAILDNTAGPETGGPFAVERPRVPFLEAARRDPAALRIAVSRHSPVEGLAIDADVSAALDTTASDLERLGHHVELADPSFDNPHLQRDFMSVVAAHTAAIAANVVALVGRKAARQFEARTKNLVMLGRSLSARDLVLATEGWHRTQRSLGEFMTRHDVLLTPTVPTTAVAHGVLMPGRIEEQVLLLASFLRSGKLAWAFGLVEKLSRPVMEKMAFTFPYNVTGQPAISLPLHATADGMPIGLQCVGAMNTEALLFALAGQLEREGLFAHGVAGH